MQRIYFFILIFGCVLAHAQTRNNAIASRVAQVDSVYEYLEHFQNLGIKSFGTAAVENTKDWIAQKYTQFGYAPSFDTFDYASDEGINVIVEKAGIKTNSWVIVCAHYDTKNGPGVNDNGTGVVACMQIAKILKNVPTDVGIRFIHFAAEENGLVGSNRYVYNTLNAGDDIQLVFNLDQLGGTVGEDNSKILCERDERPSPNTNNAESWRKTDTLASLISLYTYLEPILDPANASDYIPFEVEGYVITGLYQESSDNANHTLNDSLKRVDVAATTQVIQGALAATMHFARHTLSVGVDNQEMPQLIIYPNPASDFISFDVADEGVVSVTVYSQLGVKVLEKDVVNSKLDVSELSEGAYTVVISDGTFKTNFRAKLIIAPN